jgi:hypothetical protein
MKMLKETNEGTLSPILAHISENIGFFAVAKIFFDFSSTFLSLSDRPHPHPTPATAHGGLSTPLLENYKLEV